MLLYVRAGFRSVLHAVAASRHGSHRVCRASSVISWSGVRRGWASSYSFTKNLDSDVDNQVAGGRKTALWPPSSTFDLEDDLIERQEELEPRRLDEVILRIAQWLDCSYDQASRVLQSTPGLRSCHLETMDKYVDFLAQNGLGAELLRENAWLLTESIANISSKVLLVNRRRKTDTFDVNLVPLLRLKRATIKKLLQNAESAKIAERIDFLAQNLVMSRFEVVGQLLDNRHRSILTMDFDRLVRIMKFLLESSVAPRDIKKDLWIFKHNEQVMRSRFEIAKEAGAKTIKPWIFRCTEAAFEIFLNRTKLALKIAGGDQADDRIRYFAQRLGRRDIQSVVNRYPLVKSICVSKMKANFDLLYESGITADEILNYPPVLRANVDTLGSKLQQVKSRGLLGDLPLHVMFYPGEKFDRRLKRVVNMKRNEQQMRK